MRRNALSSDGTVPDSSVALSDQRRKLVIRRTLLLGLGHPGALSHQPIPPSIKARRELKLNTYGQVR
jgi:hypothetical protein